MTQTSVIDRPAQPNPREPKPPRMRRRQRGRILRTVAIVMALLVAVTGWSIASALRAPGDDTVTKLAEWGRDHGLGVVVTAAETVQYRMNPPRSGGTPDLSVLAAGAAESAPVQIGAPGKAAAAAAIPALAPMSTPVSPALKGEGVWVTKVGKATDPLVQETFVRPDKVHTSYLAGVAWMSHTLKFALHPGYQDPGTKGFTLPDHVTKSELPKLVATFNGGFKLKDAGGGIYDHGNTVGTLVPGAASLVIYKDGHATVGAWGKDVSMSPDIAYVRQNLKPLIHDGKLSSNLDGNVESTWGATLGGAYAVWRSGLGVTATGDLVYVAGDALTVSSLADLLQRAGAVTAMQLDINTAWVSYMTYNHHGSNVVPHKLVQFQRPTSRYLSSVSRDFVAAYTA